jgi:hypothetical protein
MRVIFTMFEPFIPSLTDNLVQLSIRPKIWSKFLQKGGISPKTVEIRPFFWRNFGQFSESKFYCADSPIFGQIPAKMAQVAEFFNYCVIVIII